MATDHRLLQRTPLPDQSAAPLPLSPRHPPCPPAAPSPPFPATPPFHANLALLPADDDRPHVCLEEEVNLLPGLQGPDVPVLQRGLKTLAPGGGGVVLLVRVVHHAC